MSLNDIAARIDERLEQSDGVAGARQARIVERDETKMAHHIAAYVLERADAGHDPYDLGASMVQGASIGEDESGGFLAEPVVEFLESLLRGAKDVLNERQGADAIYLDPVTHAVQYMLAHNRWPESASSAVIAKAKAALASGKSGRGKGASYGAYL